MFQLLTAPKGKRRWWATGMGFGGEAVVLAALAVAPMIWPDVIPRVVFATAIVPPGPPPPPPPRGNTAPAHFRRTLLRTVNGDFLSAPSRIPAHVNLIVDPPPEAGDIGVPGGVDGGMEGGVPGGLVTSLLSEIRPPAVVRPPEPAKPPAAVVPEPVKRIVIPGGKVNPAVPLYRPEPVYPPLARSMRVSGVVELIGVIGTDGRIKELRVKSGHPLLARAALDAVSQWVYKPTLLNERPVEVEAPITVTFRLN